MLARCGWSIGTKASSTSARSSGVRFGRRSKIAGSLSGGAQQMLAIGRALMSNPRVLLLERAVGGPGAANRRGGHVDDPAPQGAGIFEGAAAELKRNATDLRQHLGVY